MMALLFGCAMVSAQYEEMSYEGKCPEVSNTMHHLGKKLEPQRLEGLWKIIFDHEQRTLDMDCYTIKFNKDYPGLNETQLQVLVGHKYQEMQDNSFMYDDDAYFTFNHPEKSNIASVQTKEELEDPDNSKMLASLEEQLLPLTDE